MSISIAFLRGMNVGGHRITNPELGSIFTSLGFADVATFRASGNVIFSHRAAREQALQKRIEQGLKAALGYDVPTFLRSARELEAIVSFPAFSAALLSSRGKVQVTMLPRAPDSRARDQALALATDDDQLTLEGRELYWLPRGRMSDSLLDLKSLEAALGVGTMRTLGTMEGIAKKCGK